MNNQLELNLINKPKDKQKLSKKHFGWTGFMEPHPNAGMVTADSGFAEGTIAGDEFEAHRYDPEIDNYF